MGGHGVERGSDAFRQATLLGRRLAGAGMVVATGGGPGRHGGGQPRCLPRRPGRSPTSTPPSTLLAAVPSFKPSVGDWALAALDVRRRWPGGDGGLGVPTWFYGHEPPNLFAGAIAKFFQNSVREATLLNRCTAGIVFLPGAAGTVQEIFQDACENFYAAAGERDPDGARRWPLLDRHRARPGRCCRRSPSRNGFAPAVALVDDVDEAAAFVVAGRRAT